LQFRKFGVIFVTCAALLFFGCSSKQPTKKGGYKKGSPATMRPYTISGKTYYPEVVKVGDTQTGIASWYGPNFHGKKTSNGETYNMNAMTAAHKTYPMNTMVKVTNRDTGASAVVRINDRGPFVSGRIIDLSKTAAKKVGVYAKGTARVKIEVLGFNSTDNILASANSAKNPTAVAQKSPTTQKSMPTVAQKIPPKIPSEISTPEEIDISEFKPSGSEFVGGNFMVQVGAFQRLEGAKITQEKYDNFGGHKAIIREYDGFHRVFLTGFLSEAEARDFAQSGNLGNAFIVRE